MSNKFKISLVFNCIKKIFIDAIIFDDHLLNRFIHLLQTVQGFCW